MEVSKDTRISDLEHMVKERIRERDEAKNTIDTLRSQLASIMNEKQKAVE
jgi:hypothetical protein